MSITRKLRLGPLPKSVKLTFTCPVGPKADLDRYAALHAQTCGEAVDGHDTDSPHVGSVHVEGSRFSTRQGKSELF